ncbi:unnamed protein product [Darwinula stevensoni]|uniref:protein acetyllysine N-acetyltransferase n=1 Tax=Darwinula stevensoni TaxID=69355 RepID=A0A7R8X0C2_9CRUS|nr:unnamed protein product [Darwinula stevensoni]CAG0881522.1 unnamed protein product [Darwinula stevensoni]
MDATDDPIPEDSPPFSASKRPRLEDPEEPDLGGEESSSMTSIDPLDTVCRAPGMSVEAFCASDSGFNEIAEGNEAPSSTTEDEGHLNNFGPSHHHHHHPHSHHHHHHHHHHNHHHHSHHKPNQEEPVVVSNGGEGQHDEQKTDEGAGSSQEKILDGEHVNGGEKDDDVSSTISEISNISGISGMSGQDWKPIAGPMGWIQQQMQRGADPRGILEELIPDLNRIPQSVNDLTLWKIIINILSEPPRRQKLRHVNTLEDVVRLIRGAGNILVLTGAGVSVSCGIPDFRSRDGIYARLAVDFPDLPDPQAMFDIHYFRRDARPFFKFAKEIYPGQFQPSLSHRFIRLLEKNRKLLRNYTQNIDTLEQVAGIENIIQCHGSFATATCMRCKYKVDAEAIRADIMEQKIPYCPKCPLEEHLESQDPAASSSCSSTSPNSSCHSSHCSHQHVLGHGLPPPKPILKPDIVFFGEGLPETFHKAMAEDKDKCDLLIVIGSSLKVKPVALIPSSIPASVPQILINRESLNHVVFDVELLGDCDRIVLQLAHRSPLIYLLLGENWNEVSEAGPPCQEIKNLPPRPPSLDGGDKDSGEERAPRSEHDLEALRACWQPKILESVSDRLPEGTYFHMQPNKYIFKGAEVFLDPDNEENHSDDDDDSSSSSDSLSSLPSPPSPQPTTSQADD